MRRAVALVVLLVALVSRAAARDVPAAAPGVDSASLRAHVEFLADPAMRGRGEWATREKAAAYIAKHLEQAGLRPLPGQASMFLDTPGVKDPALRNVAAWLPSKEGPGAEYVILSAHYDHLGVKTLVRKLEDGGELTVDRMYPGADDNASGVAALLELARCFGKTGGFDRSLVFVAFDLEEQNLQGSRQWVKAPPLPLDRCAAFLTMDMLGRSLADMLPGDLFLMGTENSAGLDALVRNAPEPEGGRTLIAGIDLQPGQSDYVPFKDAKIPYLLITSGACEDYHGPGDRVARVHWARLASRARWVHGFLPALLDAKERPAWREGVEPSVGEIETIRYVIGVAKEWVPKTPGLPPIAGRMVSNFHAYLGKILEDGVVTKQERTNARNTAMTLFRMAVQAQGR